MFGRLRSKRPLDLVCPLCGHTQQESSIAVSTNCGACGAYLKIEKGQAIATGHQDNQPRFRQSEHLDTDPNPKKPLPAPQFREESSPTALTEEQTSTPAPVSSEETETPSTTSEAPSTKTSDSSRIPPLASLLDPETLSPQKEKASQEDAEQNTKAPSEISAANENQSEQAIAEEELPKETTDKKTNEKAPAKKSTKSRKQAASEKKAARKQKPKDSSKKVVEKSPTEETSEQELPETPTTSTIEQEVESSSQTPPNPAPTEESLPETPQAAPNKPSIYRKHAASHEKGSPTAGTSNKARLNPLISRDRKREVQCFDCEKSHEILADSQSTLCPFCGSYINLENFDIRELSNSRIQTRGNVFVHKRGSITGTTIHCHNLTIEGEIRGGAECSGDFVVRRTGKINGPVSGDRVIVERRAQVEFMSAVEAREVIIDGDVTGSIICQNLILRKRATLEGDLTVTTLSIEGGACHNGNINMLPPSND